MDPDVMMDILLESVVSLLQIVIREYLVRVAILLEIVAITEIKSVLDVPIKATLEGVLVHQ